MRSPGAAFTSITAPPIFLTGCSSVVAMTSMPAMSRPTMLAMRSAMKRLALWTVSVTSIAEPPVERFAVSSRRKTSPSGSTVSSVWPARSSRFAVTSEVESRVITFSWP